MFELVKELSTTFGVSGSEDKIRELIKSKVQGKVDEIYTDTMGNLICIKKGKGEKVMLAAHMDEIGVIATHIDDKGFIRFSNIGGVSPFYALGQKVMFENGTMGAVYYEEKLESMKDLKLSSMYIDIGAHTKEETMSKVKVGDTACFWSVPHLEGNHIIGKAMDDRSGCAVLIEAMQKMPKTNREIYYVFTVQEEVGLRGAKTAAFALMPDWSIAIDVTLTGDTPNCKIMEVSSGRGPAIKIKDNSVLCHKEVIERLRESAKKIKIPFQYEILEAGGTDAGAIHLTAGGIPSGAVSIPCRYTHTPVETIHLQDLKNAVKLVCETVAKG